MWSLVTSVYREALSSLLLRVVLGLLVLLLVQWVWSRRRLYALSWRIPGPFSLPFLGNAVQLGALSSHQDMINCLARMKDHYGGFWRIWMGPSLCIVVTEPDDFESVMMSRLTSVKGAPYDVVKTGMGEGLITLSGERWKHHRNLINPVFSNKRMKEYQHIHNKNARHLVDGLLEVCNKGYHDVSVFAMRFSADEICHGLFEWETKFYTGKKDHILSMTRWSAQLLHERICKVWLTPDITYKYTQHSQIFQHYLKQYKEFYYDTLKERLRKINSLKTDPWEKTDMKKQLHDEPTYEFDDELFEDKGEKMTMMSVLSDAVRRGEMTEDELCDEFNNFISPGIDTGFTQLSSFLLLMAMHPDHQERAWKEIKELFQDDLDADVTVDHFAQLPFLDLCMKETMRLFATAPVQIRYLPNDFFMKSRNMTIPAGTSIMMCNFLVHKDPRYWKDPNLFIPERFADKSTTRPHFSFLPFSGGQRNCIAQTYGYDSWKTAAIHIIRNYVLYTDLRIENLTYKASISVRSAVGYNLKFFKRNTNL